MDQQLIESERYLKRLFTAWREPISYEVFRKREKKQSKQGVFNLPSTPYANDYALVVVKCFMQYKQILNDMMVMSLNKYMPCDLGNICREYVVGKPVESQITTRELFQPMLRSHYWRKRGPNATKRTPPTVDNVIGDIALYVSDLCYRNNYDIIVYQSINCGALHTKWDALYDLFQCRTTPLPKRGRYNDDMFSMGIHRTLSNRKQRERRRRKLNTGTPR